LADAAFVLAGRYSGAVWRLVEAQHVVSTMKLVDNLDEQALLEDLLDASKPPVPPECRGLHYLLATPFRYGAVYPHGSRFRRAGMTPGVLYGSEHVRTALAEMAFYRLLFLAESPGTPWPNGTSAFTAFSARIATASHVDLASAAFDDHRAALEHLSDYAACQHIGDEARRHGTDLIRFHSVRDPERGANIAVLTCRAFAEPAPVATQSWQLRLSAASVQALGPGAGDRHTFPLDWFAADARLAGLATR
jgi:hypothetical protein